MAQVKFEALDAPHILVSECSDSLTVSGGEVNLVSIEVEGAETNLAASREGNTITVQASNDCMITCPAGSSLTVTHSSGKVRVRGLTGAVQVTAALGDVSLRDVGAATIGAAHGEVDARHIKGDLTVSQVYGDVHLRHVEGLFKLEQCMGDVGARDVLGGAQLHAMGEVALDTELGAGCEYRITAQGDIKMRIPSDSDVRCILEAGGDVRCGLPLTGSDKTAHRITGQLGPGAGLLELRAQGDIRIKSIDQEPGTDLDVRIAAVVDAELTAMEQRLQTDLTGMGELGALLSERLHRKVERAAERARRELEKEAERARREAERARRHAEREAERARRRAAGPQVTFNLGGMRPPAPPDPAPEQERLAILKMVEEKKITASDAALLLEALEGK